MSFLKNLWEKKETKKKDDDEDGGEEFKDDEPAPLYLVEHFTKLCMSEKFADCWFIVGKEKKRIPAHRLVLAASSPLFEAMLYPNPDFPKETSQQALTGPMEISLPKIDPGAFQQFLKCIYSDKLELDASNIQEFVALGKKYAIDKLQVICADFMEADVTIENVLELFQIAPSLLDDKEFGLKFIEEHADEVLEQEAFERLSKSRVMTILEDDNLGVDEWPLFQAVLRWGKAECKRQEKKSDSGDDLRAVLADLLPMIRFPAMELEDIASNVAPSGILSQDQLLDLFKYVSTKDEKEKSNTACGFNTTSRAGGFVTKESKILDARKHKKDFLRFFGIGTGPGMKGAGGKKPKLQLLYRGSRDGFMGTNFHQRCDGKGPTITVLRSTGNGNIFGGYTADSWSGSGNYQSSRAWLFSLQNKYNKAVRLESTSPGNNTYHNASYGPTFGGGHDLHVTSSMKTTSNYCNPSSYRTITTGFESVTVDNTLLSGSYNWTVDEIEVFSVKDYTF